MVKMTIIKARFQILGDEPIEENKLVCYQQIY
jgi:hypothetical protein